MHEARYLTFLTTHVSDAVCVRAKFNLGRKQESIHQAHIYVTLACRMLEKTHCEATGASSAFSFPYNIEPKHLSHFGGNRVHGRYWLQLKCVSRIISGDATSSQKIYAKLCFPRRRPTSSHVASRYQRHFCEGLPNAPCPQSLIMAILAL
jgi:hypothetical protein